MCLSGVADTLTDISAQEALIDVAATPPLGSGYVPRRGGPLRRKGSMTTSLTLHADERELLERLAVADNVTLAEVWRRGLRAYARELGLNPDSKEDADADV